MKKTRNRFVLGFILGMVAMAVVVVSIGAGLYYSKSEEMITVRNNTKNKMDYLERMIDGYYLGKVDEKQLEEGVYKGLLSGLGDPYSTYYTAEEYRQFVEESMGIYYGIGVVVSQDVDTGIITIIRAYEDAPAAKAGVKDGDLIYKVEGEEVTGKDLNSVVAQIKGEKGTQVKLTVYRESEKKYIDVTITREEINIPTVGHKMLDEKNKIGYIQITQFEQVTYDQFVEAIKDLKKQGMKAVIFDVRNNPGGLYDTVCNMLDYLLPEGMLVYTKDKYGIEEEMTSDAECLNIPMVVLQNGNSASASEIFAGAIQDFGAGKVVGTQSFGKGIVQKILPLNDGSAIKLTIQNYYTPSGKNIHGKGITPDIEIDVDDGSQEDQQLLKAQETIKGLMKK